MGTTFTVRLSKDSGEVYTIDLGKDVLEDVDEDERDNLARVAKVIGLQSAIRSGKTIDDGVKNIAGEFPDVTCKEGKVPTASKTALLKVLSSIPKEELEALVAKYKK